MCPGPRNLLLRCPSCQTQLRLCDKEAYSKHVQEFES